MRFVFIAVAWVLFGIGLPCGAEPDGEGLMTNHFQFPNPPSWLTESKAEKVAQKIQSLLEWDILRVKVYFYTSREEFEKVAGRHPTIRGLFRRSDATIHLAPEVTANSFDATFGHELCHVILFQKYKGAIPIWLEEGLANHESGVNGPVDYLWLSKQPGLADITQLAHPFGPGEDARYHYLASTALVEMIASHCNWRDLVQLSVGKGLEGYLSTFCNINNVDAEYRAWVVKKAAAMVPRPLPKPESAPTVKKGKKPARNPRSR